MKFLRLTVLNFTKLDISEADSIIENIKEIDSLGISDIALYRRIKTKMPIPGNDLLISIKY